MLDFLNCFKDRSLAATVSHADKKKMPVLLLMLFVSFLSVFANQSPEWCASAHHGPDPSDGDPKLRQQRLRVSE